MTDLPERPQPETVPTEPIEESGMPDLSALDGIEAELDAVERALERLDEGTYGTCEVCAAELADDLLAQAPTGRRCADHAA